MKYTIEASNGAEVYRNRIHEITDDFIARLDKPEDIENSSIFRALLKEIYFQLFKPSEAQQYNAQTALDLDDIALLNELWDTYAMLCYLHRHTPTMAKFSLMTGLSPQTFSNWSSGNTRANSRYFESCKKWLSECESSLEDRAIESNSIGSIFALKAAHGWREAAPIVGEYIEERSHYTPEEIAAKYADSAPPKLPDLND